MSLSSRPGFIFISYKSEEASTAAPLHQALIEEGFNVWWDADLQCGQAWAEKLDEAIRDAACIVVLWSERSVASQWVRHEASQAIARGVYAPCRIGLVQLESPYDRIQATDLIGWNTDHKHGGFRNLIARVETLIPAPISLPRRIESWLRANFATVVASSIAASAIFLLITIFNIQQTMFDAQKAIFDAQRADRLEKIHECSTSSGLRVKLAKEIYSQNKNLKKACLQGAHLAAIDFKAAILIDANLSGADLTLADLSKAKLIKADLTKAILREGIFNRAVFNKASLREAKLSGAKLRGAFFDNADLRGADLSKADLSKADLSGADFSGANLSGADFSGACADRPPIGWTKNYGQLPPCPIGGNQEGG